MYYYYYYYYYYYHYYYYYYYYFIVIAVSYILTVVITLLVSTRWSKINCCVDELVISINKLSNTADQSSWAILVMCIGACFWYNFLACNVQRRKELATCRSRVVDE